MKGLYIHIPFCKTICSYCDFPKRIGNHDMYVKYTKRLLEEIEYYNDEIKDCNTVYIGGGTPNVFDYDLLDMILSKIDYVLASSIESTIELNPELVTKELCQLLAKHRINRVSLGVQSVNPNTIKLLNRHHDKNDIINSFNYLRQAGITNINCDLMFGIPGESLEDYKNDLDFILGLNPTHLSCYSLILEERTTLMHWVDTGIVNIPDDDIAADMYEYTNKLLKDKGYIHYETSNYAKSGFESKHNMIYWTLDEYIGIGAGASGYLNNTRYDNHREVNKYLEEFIDNSIEETINDKKNEFMMLGLRLLRGVNIDEYQNIFKSSIWGDFNLDKLLKMHLLEVNNGYLRIPEDKMLLANMVWSEFI